MTRESESLLGYGIRLRSYAEGDHRTTCPECSHSRRKKSEPCLAVKIDVEVRYGFAIIAVGPVAQVRQPADANR